MLDAARTSHRSSEAEKGKTSPSSSRCMGSKKKSEKIRVTAIETLAPILRPARV